MNIRGEQLLKERERAAKESFFANIATAQDAVCVISSLGPQKKKPKFRKTYDSIWGDPRTLAGRRRFQGFLKSLKSADRFLKGEGPMMWLRNLPPKSRRKIFQRLREVDPMGVQKLLAGIRGVTRSRTMRKKVEKVLKLEAQTATEVAADTVAIAEKIDCAASPNLLRLMPLGGLTNMLALCVAAGHTRDEVAAMAGMNVSEFNAIVTPQMVREAAQDMPKAITHLANGMVLRDLIKGVVTPMTKEADMIVQRRTKVAVEVSKEGRERTKFSDELEKKREAELSKRFGVDRTKGEVIDASNKS